MAPTLFEKPSGRPDLNRRPLDPQSSALPNCATSRCREARARRGGGIHLSVASGAVAATRWAPGLPAGATDRRGRQGVLTAMPDRLATLVPYPATVRALPGQLALHRDTPVTAGPAARQAADPVRQVLAALPWPASSHPASDARQEILVDADGTLPAEGYRLLIGPDRVKISAAGPAGA